MVKYIEASSKLKLTTILKKWQKNYFILFLLYFALSSRWNY